MTIINNEGSNSAFFQFSGRGDENLANVETTLATYDRSEKWIHLGNEPTPETSSHLDNPLPLEL